jgi:hypothetical protein
MNKKYVGRKAVVGMLGLCLGMVFLVTSANGAAKKADAAAEGASDGATLMVTRSASIGSGVSVNLSVDGKQVSIMGNRGHYKGTLSPGKHVLSVVPDPNTGALGATKLEVTAEKGKSYSFSVHSKNGKLELVAGA